MNRWVDQAETVEEARSMYPEVTWPDDWRPRRLIGPTQKALIIHPGDTRLQASEAVFGLIPSWAEDRKTHFENARSESVWEKRSFRDLIPHHRRRCLVPVTGYWEWDPHNVRHHLRPRAGGLWLFAGLHHTWSFQDQQVHCFTFLTLDAPAFILPVHDRVPVVLTREEGFDLWLSPRASPEQLKALYHTSTEADTFIEERPSGPVQERLF